MKEQSIRWLLAELRQKADPTDDDVARCDELIAELETTVKVREAEEARAVKIADLERRVASGELVAERVSPPVQVARHDADNPYRGDIRTTSAGEARDRAMQALERRSRELAPHQLDHADRLLRQADRGGQIARHILVTGSEEYRAGWAKLMTENGHLLSDGERRAVEEARALSMTTNQGGYAVPFELDPTVVLTNDGTINPIRAISRVESVMTEAWNGVSSDGVTAEWTAEAAESGDNAPTLAQPTVNVHKATAFVPFSVEIGGNGNDGDWRGLATEVGRMIADAKDRLEATAFATGSGTNQPWGIVTALDANTNSELAVTTNNQFGAVDVYALTAALPPRWRPGASFVASLQYINLIRQFATANNYHAYLTDMTGSSPAQLLGYPLYEFSEMDLAIGTGTDNAVVFGNFQNYLIADRVGLSTELVPHLFHTSNNRPSGQRGIYAWWRVGADSINDKAFRLLQI